MAEEEQPQELANNVTIEQIGPCKKKVTVEVPEESVKKATDEQYETLHKDAIVPGFRKGRAPRRLLEKRFGKEVSEQIKLKLLSDASEAAIKDNELDILREPDIDYEKVELPEEGPLRFEFEAEVKPQFELPPLEGIAVEKARLEVTQDQIDREIEQLQKWSGLWTPREGGEIELEDRITADVVLKVEDVEEEEKLNNIEIFVRPNGFVGGVPVEKLDDLLIGAKCGDKKQVAVDVPKTYFKEQYRGKKVNITIDIEDIKWLKPAEIDEAFLTRLSVENEAELRERLHDMVQGRLEQQWRTEMTEQIYTYLLDNTEFDLPVDIVADQSTMLLQRQYSNLLMKGIPREQVEQQMQQLQAGSDEQAQRQLKTFFIMDKIADTLEIEVSDEEVNGHIAQLAIQRHQRPEKMREDMLRDGSLTQFKLQVREDKCIAKLLESAEITQVEPKKETPKVRKKTAKATKKSAPKTSNETTTTEKKKMTKKKAAAKKKTEE